MIIELVRRYLLLDIECSLLDIWRLAELQGYSQRDTGIDLVAETQLGEHHAV